MGGGNSRNILDNHLLPTKSLPLIIIIFTLICFGGERDADEDVVGDTDTCVVL